MVFTNDDIKKLRDELAKAPTIVEEGFMSFAMFRPNLEAILDRLETAEKVIAEGMKIDRAFQLMERDHFDKLVDHQTFESACENWDKLLQEPVDFAPFRRALDVWMSVYGRP